MTLPLWCCPSSIQIHELIHVASAMSPIVVLVSLTSFLMCFLTLSLARFGAEELRMRLDRLERVTIGLLASVELLRPNCRETEKPSSTPRLQTWTPLGLPLLEVQKVHSQVACFFLRRDSVECVQVQYSSDKRAFLIQVPEPFSLPVESPFLSRRRSSSTDSCKKSPLHEYPSDIARTTSAVTPRNHAKSKRDMSAQCLGHHQQGLAGHKASASWDSSRCGVPSASESWESSRCGVPLGVLSKMQRHSTMTTAQNDAADTREWVSHAGSHYPKRVASHSPKKVTVQSKLPVDRTKKAQPKRQNDTQPNRIASAPQLAAHNSVTIHHLSSGSLKIHNHHIWHMPGHWNHFQNK